MCDTIPVEKWMEDVDTLNKLPDVTDAGDQLRNWWIVRNHMYNFSSTHHIAHTIQRLMEKDIDQLPDDVLDNILINGIVNRLTP